MPHEPLACRLASLEPSSAGLLSLLGDTCLLAFSALTTFGVRLTGPLCIVLPSRYWQPSASTKEVDSASVSEEP